MSELVVFTKLLKNINIDELISLMRELEFAGYDLCVRPGYVINPAIFTAKLPETIQKKERVGLRVPMVTGSFDLLIPDQPEADTILQAMDKAGIRLLKPGYFIFDSVKQDYWQEVEKIRNAFAGWEEPGKIYSTEAGQDELPGLIKHEINFFKGMQAKLQPETPAHTGILL